VITLIHRQESLSLLGFPLARYIDIDDAESTLQAIRQTPSGRAIEIILHTPGGLVLAAQQIAGALAAHDGKVTAVVPHYAMSGGTLIALAADEIVLDAHAALGPVDPQLGQYPAASLVEVANMPGEHDDQTLIMADVGRKAIAQVEGFVERMLTARLGADRAREAARLLATGIWTHDHPLKAPELATIGLPVRVGVPAEERELMTLYPQPRGRTPAVEYSPGPAAPTFPARRVRPRSLGRRG
jgi:ClpP class serine protease